VEHAYTFIPNFCAYCIAKCPRLPIPTIAHFPHNIPCLLSGAKTVTPAFSIGAALFNYRLFGN